MTRTAQTSQYMSTPAAPLLLALPDPGAGLPAVEFARAVRAAAEAVPLDDLPEAERVASAEALRQEELRQDQRALACKLLRLGLARRIGAALPPAPGGRGKRVADPFGLDKAERHRYRAMAEPTESEYLAWLERTDEPTRTALIALGKRLRRERDRQTGEPLPREPRSGEEPAPAPAPPPAPQGLANPGVVRALEGLLADLASDPHPTSPELARALRRALAVAGALTPTAGASA